MKTHFHTTVTLGAKNQKGLLLPEDKQFDHLEVRLHPALSEYARLARPHLTLVDGIVGMEGEGPTKGRPKRAGVIALGTDIYETDFACARFMGVDPMKVRHLAYAVERGHFDGVAPDETVAYEFAKVRHLYAARLGLPDRCEIEWFAGPHTIHGEGTFRFLHRHLDWPER